MSARQIPIEIGSAAIQWFCSRRGRTLLFLVVFFTLILGLAGIRHSEMITAQYHALSEYQWRPYFASTPKLTSTPSKAPSNTTLQLENGEIAHLPPKLEKSTPNFHLLMTSEKDSDDFCKSTLSAMLLDYPPPTGVNLHQTFVRPGHKEWQTLSGIKEYLHNKKLVHDDDLLLIVDGQDTWFQLPSDVIIMQYEAVVEYANARLLKKYGVDEDKHQRFTQTIVFGAEKSCQGDATTCKYSPESILPHHLYGVSEDSNSEKDFPARYLNSRVVMGPAKDLRALFDAALKKFQTDGSERQTMQSVLALMFGEQQLRRDAALIKAKSASDKLREWVGKTSKDHAAAERRLKSANADILPEKTHEYSVGLDYTHTLFQPLALTQSREVLPLKHDNLTDLSLYRHPSTITPHLSLPPTLLASKLPFWSPDLYLHNPSPETNKPAYIDELAYDFDLDRLPDRHTLWSDIPLVQNTYTGAIPALVIRHFRDSGATSLSSDQMSFNNLWFAKYKRALLRQYFRTPQSPNGYHNFAVGGDRLWDQRGGRGGVWTSKEQIWLPWGEVDGVCGTLAHLKEVFDDGKGVWMHELEDDNEGQRVRSEEAYERSLGGKRKEEKDEEAEQVKKAAEKVKMEHEQAEKEEQNKAELEEEEGQRKKEMKGFEAEGSRTTAPIRRRMQRWTA
ncbi:uncharacterized protein M421DRAFT_59348 [Didymella exigua CBS 183.55]|uniref:Uncharacterized protein n=1 Tax=Didymella exigua CBS 183.55 TaxID=1150837 RepID=A0A6A5RQI2_9PLEO|nr:uncharacterized protein M421DRAFT_59348 [Didymella exigua CBS 183.55]KAF1930042.1 hypothetical protein M421DRAFT_59348 [Didymella exigua CBS 183.55]